MKPITIENQPLRNVFLQVLDLVFDNDIDRMIQFIEEKGSEEQKEKDLPIALEYKRDMKMCRDFQEILKRDFDNDMKKAYKYAEERGFNREKYLLIPFIVKGELLQVSRR